MAGHGHTVGFDEALGRFIVAFGFEPLNLAQQLAEKSAQFVVVVDLKYVLPSRVTRSIT